MKLENLHTFSIANLRQEFNIDFFVNCLYSLTTMARRITKKLKLIFIPTEENRYRPTFLDGRFLTYYLIVLIVLKLISVPILLYLPRTIFFADITKTNLIALTNQGRQSLGLRPLKESPILDKAALLKARDMLENNYFSHWSPTGISPWYWFKKEGYSYEFAGENLAIGFLDSSEVYQAWLASPPHKKNLLNPNYKEIGIAVARGSFKGRNTVVVVQLFGTPLPKPTVAKENKNPSEEQKRVESPQPISKNKIPSEKKVIPEKRSTLGERSITQKKVLQKAKSKPENNFYAFLNSDYSKLLQIIIYASLLIIIISLIVNIFVRFDVQHKDLILKAVGFIALLILFAFVDKAETIKLIPHLVSIY